MSVSPKQLEANRLNAQKSTGPTSSEGKARSAMNGHKHGFTGLAVVMTDEDRTAMYEFIKPCAAALKPAGPLETQLAETIAMDQYRLNRIKMVEENTFSFGEFGRAGNIDTEDHRVHHAGAQAKVFALEGKVFTNLSLYEQRITRNIHKNFKLYYEMQDRRKSEERENSIVARQPKPLTRTATAGYEQNGFVYANLEMPDAPTANPAPDTTQSPPFEAAKAA